MAEDRHRGKQIVMRIPDELEAALRLRAKNEDRTLNSIMRKALRAELGVELEYLDFGDTQQRREDREHDDTIDEILEVLHP